MSERRRLSSPLIRALRFMARPLASLRQAEKQFPQADPLLFRRRFAPLTPAPVRASRFASANHAKEFFVSAALILAMLAPLSASAEQAISHRLMAQSFSLTELKSAGAHLVGPSSGDAQISQISAVDAGWRR